MVNVSHDNIEEIIHNWEYGVDPASHKNLYDLLRVNASEHQRIDLEIESLYENRDIMTASGLELEKLGIPVNVFRQEGETDKTLRVRIISGYASQASNTTFESFAKAALLILDTTAGSIEIHQPTEDDPKTVKLDVDGTVIDEHPMSVEELQEQMNGAVSVDAHVEISSTGTFAFEGDNTSLEGFNEGTWSSVID